MITIEAAFTFFVINVTVCLVPSVEMIIVITQSTLQGRMAGIAFVIGVCMALVVQVVLMGIGVSAIIQTSTLLFTSIKIIGVCYLAYLSWQMFTQPIAFTMKNTPEPTDLAALVKKGVIVNVSNPLTPLYLLLFLPAFINADQGNYLAQALQLGFVMIVAVFLVFTVMSIVVAKVGSKFLHSENVQYYLRMGAGSTIAGFAIYLALAQQSL